MMPQISSEIQVYSRLIKIGQEYIVEFAQVETINLISSEIIIPEPIASPTPTFSSEYYLLVLLLCLVPILIVIAFIYGKRMGQREKGSSKNTKDENILEKLTISQKSTKENSSPISDREFDEGLLPEELESLPPTISYTNSNASSQTQREEKSSEPAIHHIDTTTQEASYRRGDLSALNKSCTDEKSQESWKSSIVDETQPLDIVRHDIDDSNIVNAVISYEIDPSKGVQCQYPIPVKELISLHSDENQVKNRKVKFGVSTEIENGRLVKKETLETITTYEKDAIDPELNAQALKRGISNISQNSQSSLPLQIKAAEEISEPSESPVLENKVSVISTVKSESEKTIMVSTPKLLQNINETRIEQPQIMQYVPDNSKILALLESEDLPDETGKFNKVFREAELIGEGSFGAVYKVTHRLDSKLYAVKKIKLKLKRHDDLHKRSKVLREVFAISNLQHPNIVRYSTCWVEIESSKRVSRATSKPVDTTNKSLLAIKPSTSSSSMKKKQMSELMEESSMAFEFEAQPEESQQEETVEGEEYTLTEKSQPYLMEKSVSETLVDDVVEGSSYLASEMSTPGKLNYLGDYDLYLYIQMEFCAGLNLRNYLDIEDRKVDRKTVLQMFKKLLEGVNAIHKCGILHRDLKPANIFLDNNENVKIGDFGLASLGSTEESTGNHQIHNLNLNMERSHSMMVGTPMYTSPEQEKGKKYNQKTDVYSLGLILCEMLNTFSTSHERYLFFNKIKKDYTLPESFRAKFSGESELIIKMTANLPEDRPTVEDTINEINKLISEGGC